MNTVFTEAPAKQKQNTTSNVIRVMSKILYVITYVFIELMPVKFTELMPVKDNESMEVMEVSIEALKDQPVSVPPSYPWEDYPYEAKNIVGDGNCFYRSVFFILKCR